MGPGDLARALCGLSLIEHPDLLVGLEKGDDAGVYRLTDELALVLTVDFFTPIVDDPFLFGQVAAANALSDVYAMGGTPICAMNIAGFPSKEMDIAVLREVFKGGLSKLREAGAVLVGGHTVEDKEIKYGLAVTGTIHPGKILRKRGAQLGDALILTKRLGTGIVATAIKAGAASAEEEQALVASMITLNRVAAQALTGIAIHACTDITGFGLIGHLGEMLDEGKVGAELSASALTLLPGVERHSAMGLLPGGLQRNREYCSSLVECAAGLATHQVDVLFDPQTSGGLLLALPADQAALLLERLGQHGVEQAAVIGEISASHPSRVIVRK